jgi:hypothetical protein
MVKMEAGLVGAVVVADPSAVMVDVRGLGMAFLVAKSSLRSRFAFVMWGSLNRCRPGRSAVNGRRAVFGNVSAADVVTATSAVPAVLGPGGDGKDQEYS